MDFGQTELFFSDQTSVQDLFLVNNLVVTGMGEVLKAVGGASTPGTGTNQFFTNNSDGGNSVFQDPDNADFRVKDGVSGVFDAAQANGAPEADIGFDPGCIKREEGQLFDFWHHAPDYDYIESVGGVEGCFSDVKPRSAPDMGAYEK